jgi:hypothetical protein
MKEDNRRGNSDSSDAKQVVTRIGQLQPAGAAVFRYIATTIVHRASQIRVRASQFHCGGGEKLHVKRGNSS